MVFEPAPSSPPSGLLLLGGGLQGGRLRRSRPPPGSFEGVRVPPVHAPSSSRSPISRRKERGTKRLSLCSLLSGQGGLVPSFAGPSRCRTVASPSAPVPWGSAVLRALPRMDRLLRDVCAGPGRGGGASRQSSLVTSQFRHESTRSVFDADLVVF